MGKNLQFLPTATKQCCVSHRFDADPDSDTTFHFDADLDPNPDPDSTQSFTHVEII